MKLTLKSSDGKLFQVDEAAGMKSQVIMSLREEINCGGKVIPIPNVDSKILTKMIEYMEKHAGTVATEKEKKDLMAWDEEYMKVDLKTMYYLLVAANYMEVRDLLSLASHTVAGLIKGKSPEEIRQTFNIKNDFTLEEEEEIRNEHGLEYFTGSMDLLIE